MTTETQTQPQRARSVFSTEDFRLLRNAIAYYLQQEEARTGPDTDKYGRLYHRLGRIDY